MRTLFALAALFGFPLAASRAEELSPEKLASLKHATVFIKVESGRVSGTGSGFTVLAKGGRTLVVTNHHVIVPPVEGAVRPVRGRVGANVTVVFDSGTRQESSVRADVLALDPAHDLAILSVPEVPDQTTVIDYQTAPKLYETMQVYTLGFPFGGALSTTGRGPAITVGNATVSSVRTGEDGDVRIVQIDGALNPGNSGGPVVDTKGRLVGVALASLKDGAGINFAIPAEEVVRTLDGRVGPCVLTPGRADDGSPVVRVEVPLIDPQRRFGDVTLYYAPVESARGPMNGERLLKSLPGCRKVALRLDRGAAVAEVPTGGGRAPNWLVQVEYDNGSGNRQFTPVVMAAPEPDPAPRVAAREPAGAPARRRPVPEPRARPSAPVRGSALSRDPKRAPDETDIVGGVFNPNFRDVAPRGGVLVGFHVGYGRFVNHRTVISIRPRYLTPDGLRSGRLWGLDDSQQASVHARRGYAVGAVTVHPGLLINGIKVTFMRMKKDGTLDVNDSYDSDWLGTPGGDLCPRLGGDGSLVVGICGRGNNKDLTGLGLILSTKGPEPAAEGEK